MKKMSVFKRLMTEGPGNPPRNEAPGLLGVFLNQLKSEWMEHVSGDPTIRDSGTWEMEVDKAIDVLDERLTEVIGEVEDNLVQGMYQKKFGGKF